jgi:hypothetical protein
MVASLWSADPDRSHLPAELLVDCTARIQAGKQGFGARTPSRASLPSLDLQIGATTFHQVRTGRGWLWKCGCGREVLHIYCPPNREPGCRHCLGLKYACRHVGRGLPEAQRIRKLREKLGAEPRPFAELPARRRWQHRVTRLRLLKRLAELEEKLAARFAGMTRDLERRARVRKLKPPTP